jgi:hypothetical protein
MCEHYQTQSRRKTPRAEQKNYYGSKMSPELSEVPQPSQPSELSEPSEPSEPSGPSDPSEPSESQELNMPGQARFYARNVSISSFVKNSKYAAVIMA